MNMATASRKWPWALVGCLMICATSGPRARGDDYFPSFADRHTVALWLFDDPDYVSTTVTDAGQYENDLCLMRGGKLTPGRFGRALRIVDGPEPAVSYAGFQGAISLKHMRTRDGQPVGTYSPTIAPQTLEETLAGTTWTLEFWVKFEKEPASAVMIDLGNAYEAGFTLALSGANFVIDDAYAGLRAVCPTERAALSGNQWHHVAFTRAGEQLRHFLDGKVQGTATVSAITKAAITPAVIPAARGKSNTSFAEFSGATTEEWRKQRRFNLMLGTDRHGSERLPGMLDEMRLSDVVRYDDAFTPPASLSRNYGAHPPAPAVPSGPPLLFAGAGPSIPLQLGSRKHLFIDDAILHARHKLKFTCNPPWGREPISDRGERGSGNPSVLDHDGKVYMYVPEGYSSPRGGVRLLVSEDGLHFNAPVRLGKDSSPTNDLLVITGRPSFGDFFKDPNPQARPEELFKNTAWIANRGIYLCVSPDGIHWRRNETTMLPFASGGGVESYWDDQRGVYSTGIRRDSSWHTPEFPGDKRRVCVSDTREPFKTWPFRHLERPYFEGWPFPSLTGELPVMFAPSNYGEVYRSRMIKYPWAPDVYLAFVWRFQKANHERRLVDLGVSRDAHHWKFFADQVWYGSSDRESETLSIAGLIRRGDEIWQYMDYGGNHGKAPRVSARVKQRLDGFVSLDAGNEMGSAVTLPLVFAGERLVLNIVARGDARVGLLDEEGNAIPGFAASECDEIRKDATHATVSWRGKTGVGALAGKVVRLRFELRDASLFAFEFSPGQG